MFAHKAAAPNLLHVPEESLWSSLGNSDGLSQQSLSSNKKYVYTLSDARQSKNTLITMAWLWRVQQPSTFFTKYTNYWFLDLTRANLAWDILCSMEIIWKVSIPIFKHKQGTAPKGTMNQHRFLQVKQHVLIHQYISWIC